MKTRRLAFVTLACLAISCERIGHTDRASMGASTKATSTNGSKIVKTEDEWKQQLTREQYHVTREKGTEAPFTGKYCNHKADGTYTCVGCGQELFQSNTKFDSGSGWPSFYQPINEDNVDKQSDSSIGMNRNEILCSRCDAHLGHVFNDGPAPTGLRYCINSASLNFEKKK